MESILNVLISSDISDHLPIFHLASLSSNIDKVSENIKKYELQKNRQQ